MVQSASLADIAESAGLSVATVSKVLNHAQGTNVKAATRDRVLKVAAELHYRPNRAARFFERGRTGQIAVVIPRIYFTNYSWRASASLTMEIYDGISAFFARQSYMTNLIFTPSEHVKEFLHDALLKSHCVDGVILFGGDQELACSPEFLAMGVPVVSFDPNGSRYDLSHTEECPETGIRQAVDYLAGQRCPSVGSLCFFDRVHAQHAIRRTELFCSLCREAGIEVMERFQAVFRDETDAYVKTAAMFAPSVSETPRVMFYPSDHSAMMGMRALIDSGRSVPGDVGVLGFDDAPFNINAAVPLATVAMPRHLQGERGAQLLFEQINDSDREVTRTLSIHTKFVLRDSLCIQNTRSSQNTP